MTDCGPVQSFRFPIPIDSDRHLSDQSALLNRVTLAHAAMAIIGECEFINITFSCQRFGMHPNALQSYEGLKTPYSKLVLISLVASK